MRNSWLLLARSLNSASCRTAASLPLVMPMMTVLAFVLLCINPEHLSAQMVKFTYNQKTESYDVTTDDGKPVHNLPIISRLSSTSSPHRYLVKSFNHWGIIDALGNVILPPMYDNLEETQGLPMRFAGKMQNKWVLLDANGATLSALYDEVHIQNIRYHSDAVRACFPFKDNGLCGFIDTNGRELVAPTFQDYETWFRSWHPGGRTSDPTATTIFWLKKADKWGLVSLPERQILPFQFDSVRVNVLNEKSIAFVQLMLPCQYEEIHRFHDSLLCLKSKGAWSLVSIETTQGNATTIKAFLPFAFDVQPEWSEYNSSSSNFYPIVQPYVIQASKQGRWGVLNSAGKEIIPFLYDEKVTAQLPDRFTAKLRGNAILINERAETLSPLGYAEIEYDNYRAALKVMKNVGGKKLFGLITTSGTVVAEPQFTDVEFVGKRYAFVQKEPSKGFALYRIDTGTILTDFIYQRKKDGWFSMFNSFNDFGTAEVFVQGRWGIIDTLGKEIHAPTLEKVWFMEKCGATALVKHSSGLWSFLSRKGEYVYKERYSDTRGFREYETLVQQNGKWGIINDSTGAEVFPCQYDSIEVHGKMFARFLRDGKWSALNVETRQELPFDMIKSPHEVSGRAVFVQKNGKWGIVSDTRNDAGAVVVPCQYDYIKEAFRIDDYVLVRRGTKYGLVVINGSERGKEVLPAEYEVLRVIYYDSERKVCNAIGYKNGVEHKITLPFAE